MRVPPCPQELNNLRCLKNSAIRRHRRHAFRLMLGYGSVSSDAEASSPLSLRRRRAAEPQEFFLDVEEVQPNEIDPVRWGARFEPQERACVPAGDLKAR